MICVSASTCLIICNIIVSVVIGKCRHGYAFYLQPRFSRYIHMLRLRISRHYLKFLGAFSVSLSLTATKPGVAACARAGAVGNARAELRDSLPFPRVRDLLSFDRPGLRASLKMQAIFMISPFLTRLIRAALDLFYLYFALFLIAFFFSLGLPLFISLRLPPIIL